MKKINLDESEINILERFAKSNSDDAKLVKKIFEFYMWQNESIRNIDDKGNMGLQALAMLKTLDRLEEIYDSIFSVGADSGSNTPKRRVYR